MNPRSVRRRRAALDTIARRFDVRVCEVDVAGRGGCPADAFQAPAGDVIVVHTAAATVADVRRVARLAAMRFRGRGAIRCPPHAPAAPGHVGAVTATVSQV